MVEISDIIVAIENKDHFVLDTFVKQGEFVKMTNGQPLRYVGGFTAVFPVEVNREKWAFRCWHANMGNVRRRFETIANAISKSNAKYLCDFAYIDKGIIVKGMQYPTTRMRWVEGQTIKEYICANASDSQKLNKLAHSFKAMAMNMHKHGFAHGDLQHGNIIIDKYGSPYLVDYDSFYCPELKGEKDIITGLVDYQHPSRKTNLLSNEKLDYFSELIIYTSILAIAEKPSFVQKYQVADSDRMLFAASDYRDIKHSAIYADLRQLSPTIQQLLDVLCIYLSKQTLNDLIPFDILLDRLTKEPEIHSFTCSPKKYLQGDKIHLSWDVENYTQVLLNGKDVSSKTFIDKIADTQTTYKLEVINYHKRVSKSLKIQIAPRPIISFKASRKKLRAGKKEEVKLTWNVQNAESCSLKGVNSDGKMNENCEEKGFVMVTPTETSTYILHVVSLDKKTIIDTPITIGVFPEAKVLYFKSDPERYVYTSFRLSWNVLNAKRVTLNDKIVKSKDSILYNNENCSTYTLSVTDDFGTKKYPLEIKRVPIRQIKIISFVVIACVIGCFGLYSFLQYKSAVDFYAQKLERCISDIKGTDNQDIDKLKDAYQYLDKIISKHAYITYKNEKNDLRDKAQWVYDELSRKEKLLPPGTTKNNVRAKKDKVQKILNKL